MSLNITAQKGEDSKDYLYLYEYLLKQNSYDEDDVKEQVTKKISKHRFAAPAATVFEGKKLISCDLINVTDNHDKAIFI